jgi:hypothetical protein
MASFGVFGLLFAMLSGGGAGDLLDFVATDAYWKAKGVAVDVPARQLLAELAVPAGDAPAIRKLIRRLGSGEFADRDEATRALVKAGAGAVPLLERAAASDADPEVASRAGALVRQIRLADRGGSVRRLMAIRTLGERRAAEAAPKLKELLASKEMFVADYAARALAAIEGKPAATGTGSDRAALLRDLTLLPADCGAVAQLAVPRAGRESVARAAAGAALPPGANRDQAVAAMSAGLIAIADEVGNVRVDGVTIGLSAEVGPDNGFFVVVVRGQFDAAAASAAVRKAGGAQMKVTTVEGVEVFHPPGAFDTGGFAFPSDDRAVLLTGAKEDKLPYAQVFAALRKEAGAAAAPAGAITAAALAKAHPLLARPEFGALVAGVEKAGDDGRLWVACRVTPSYAQAPVFAAFAHLTLLGTNDKGSLSIRLAGAGDDAAKVGAAVDQVNQGIEQARGQMAQLVAGMPALKPVADLMGTLKATSDGKTAALTGTFNGDATALFAMLFGNFGSHSEPAAQAAPPVVEEVKPEKK